MSCGPGNIGDWIIPDSPLGMPLDEVCQVHDAAYYEPDGRTRAQIDGVFLGQMLAKSPHSRWTRRMARKVIALGYYLVVRALGGRAWRRANAGRETWKGF